MRISRTAVSCPHSSTAPRATPISSPRSLKYEYELYVESEIEDYKDSVSRASLLKIGDEAVEVLRKSDQIALTELLVWQEVDRIIARRLRLPTYATWKRRRLKMLAEFRTPEHWGIAPDAAFVRELADSTDCHVLVAGAEREGPALYLAARGAAVTAVEPEEDAVERVVKAAHAAGLTERVRGLCADLGGWAPDVALHAVVCTPSAFAGLDVMDRARVIEVLQSATVDGGVHLVETIAAGTDRLPLEELHSRYHGWTISVERSAGSRETFMARKATVTAA
ncbi:SAM-dependent methyltransferase [Gemmatimonas sp. UBA7669]|uniref:SAM-dependent methyltransferase n=1 Tax=Gemmatimonas sp. UBA7669 TaxID=1946568 RepID=UPI0025B88C26|nr:hypothetical protein [Gemmatimonas sp. UBA7669]